MRSDEASRGFDELHALISRAFSSGVDRDFTAWCTRVRARLAALPAGPEPASVGRAVDHLEELITRCAARS